MSRFVSLVLLLAFGFLAARHSTSAATPAPLCETRSAIEFGGPSDAENFPSQSKYISDGNYQRAVFSPSGEYFAACSIEKDDCCTFVYEAKTGRELGRLPHHGNGGLSFSVDSKVLATGRKVEDQTVCIWRVPTGTQVHQFSLVPARPGHAGAWEVAFAPDQRHLAVGCIDGTIRTIDLTAAKESAKFASSASTVCSLAFSPDGQHLAAGSHQISIQIWSMVTGRQEASWYDGSVNALAFTRDGRLLVSGSFDQTIRIWEFPSLKQRRRLGENSGPVRSLALTPDGRTILSLSGDRIVRFWERVTGQVRARVQETRLKGDLNCVVSSAEGRLLVLGGHGGLELHQLDFSRPRTANAKESVASAWQSLASNDATEAFRAIHELAAQPQSVVRLMHDSWNPTSCFDENRVNAWIAQLGDDRFERRERATGELTKVADLVESQLREALSANPKAEVRDRIVKILAQIELGITPSERLRWLRALEVLERIGTTEAQGFIRHVAKTATDTLLRTEARSSLMRLQGAGHPPPDAK